MREDAKYLETRRVVRERRELRVHAAVYVFVNAVLFALDTTTPGGWWFYWPLVGWGVGLATHAAAVLGDAARLRDATQ